MEDMRNYKDIVKKAVAEERQNDANWGWNVKSVTKTCAKIGWGYLDYLEEETPFRVEIYESPEMVLVTGFLPNRNKVVRFIGPERWDDCRTIEEGIASAIHGMAAIAHSTY